MEMLMSLPGRLEGLLSSHGSILPKGAEHEIPLIQRDLQEIISILHGRREPQLQGHGHACWITEVRELAYDMEDCIDLYDHAAAAGSNTTPRRRNITRRRWSTTRSKRIPWISEKLKQRLWMANKIREFSLRTQEALQRHKMCDNLAGITTATGNDASSESGHHPAPCSEFGQVTHIGIDAAMNKMEEWLLDREEKLKVISIVGVAGVGKTMLANEIFRKLGRQFDCRAFVRSSQKPDMSRLLMGMLSQVRPHQPPHSHSWKVHNLISTIRTHLQDKRYLIIIDDLWLTSTLDIIKYALPDGNRCSRILATTEIEDLALQSCGYDSKYIFKMKPLGEDDSRNLFLTTVFGSPSKCPPELTEVSHSIASKCAGFPLAIVTVGRHLGSHHEKLEQLDYINKSLNYSLMTSPPLEGMKQLLNLIYNNLPHHLKACMLYLSMYQEDYIILKEDLVNQWMAEGFICEAGCVDDKEKISGGYFDELVVRKIIQPIHINDNGEVLSCVVHSVVLNFITYKSIGENFMIAIDHSQATTRHADKVRRLSIQFGNVEDATLPNNMRLSQVRTLAFSGVSKCMPYITEFQLLKVLILHLWGYEDSISFDLSRISDFFRLRYLQITSNVSLKLQTHMQGLQYLETLKIDGKSVAVPSDIVHLPHLLHLNLPAKTNLPNGIAHMTSLRTLGIFDLSCNSTENMRSLGELTNLRDLQLIYSAARSGNLMMNMKCLGYVLGNLSNLKFLILSPADSSHANISSATSMRISADVLWEVYFPPPLLQRLELSPCFCIFFELPWWIGLLGNLCILKIGVREVASNDVYVLGRLLALTVLSLYVHEKPAERIVFDGVGFSVLKYFKFRCSFSWLKFEAGAMPNLRKLKLRFDVHRPDELASIPVGIEHLLRLEEISAKAGVADDLCRRFAKSMLDNIIKMHPGRPTINMRYVAWTFDGKNVRIREEEQENIINEGSTDTSVVVQNDPGEGARKSVHKRKRKEREPVARKTEVLEKHDGLDDGFSWRKYGKKDITGAMHPRGYYRCNSKGCKATKQVQRTDGDPSLFDVVYRGKHTCGDNLQGSSRHAASSDHTQHKDSAWTVVDRRVVSVSVSVFDDGFSWRKYGQKDCFGHKYPRGYYRCTYRNTHGCKATKTMQRTNGDPSLFDVVYYGEHTCGLSSHSNKQLRCSQSAESSEHSQDKQSSTITSTHSESESVDGQDFSSAANLASVVSSHDKQSSTPSKGVHGEDFASAANLASAAASSTVTSTQSETEGVDGEDFSSTDNFASEETDEDKWVKMFAILFPSADVFNRYD